MPVSDPDWRNTFRDTKKKRFQGKYLGQATNVFIGRIPRKKKVDYLYQVLSNKHHVLQIKKSC